MTPGQKKEFETELQNSPELMEKYLKIKGNLESLKINPVPETGIYFNNLLPLFREKMVTKQKKSSFIPRFAVAASFVAVVVILMFYYYPGIESADDYIAEFFEFETSELDDILTGYFYSDDINQMTGITDQEISDKVDSVITENYLSADLAAAYFEYNSAIRVLSDEDAEFIYSQLIKKDIISGEL
jgi:hypothetical protein